MYMELGIHRVVVFLSHYFSILICSIFLLLIKEYFIWQWHNFWIDPLVWLTVSYVSQFITWVGNLRMRNYCASLSACFIINFKFRFFCVYPQPPYNHRCDTGPVLHKFDSLKALCWSKLTFQACIIPHNCSAIKFHGVVLHATLSYRW